MKVGVLALQGDVPEHVRALAGLLPPDAIVAVTRPAELLGIEALFLPGGESTTIGRLLHESGLDEAIRTRLHAGFPVLATCAGLILLAREIDPTPGGAPETLGILDVTIRRNDFGRQRESFEAEVDVDGLKEPFPGVFIRAPRIVAVGPRARPIARWGDEVVGVRQGSIWGFSFHPELAGDPRIHARFLEAALGPGYAKTASHHATTKSTKHTDPTATASQ